MDNILTVREEIKLGAATVEKQIESKKRDS